MAVVKCENGHFYDDSKYESCPHCQNQQNLPETEDQKTIANIHMQVEVEELATEMISHGVPEKDQKTMALSPKRAQAELVVGWLVCTQGPERGRDYRLHTGRNFLGRDFSMDICLADDPKVSRIQHCSVVYEPRKGKFYLAPCQGCTVYFQGNVMEAPKEIQEDDVFQVGDCSLTFIPYCRGDRKWES